VAFRGTRDVFLQSASMRVGGIGVRAGVASTVTRRAR